MHQDREPDTSTNFSCKAMHACAKPAAVSTLQPQRAGTGAHKVAVHNAERHVAQVHRGSAQPPHALRHICEVSKEVHVCGPRLVMLIAKACDQQ